MRYVDMHIEEKMSDEISKMSDYQMRCFLSGIMKLNIDFMENMDRIFMALDKIQMFSNDEIDNKKISFVI